MYTYAGKVLPGILLSNGCHCRLENICPVSEEWLQSEDFWVGSEHVVRQAGQKAHGSIMPEWRALRRQHPELFSQLRVWQQPCAVVDGVIWRWQLELEASECEQAVRVTDTLSSAWSKQSKEAAWLLQQMGCPVPEGCTAISQPTDTHLAKPGKDAARQKKEDLRELMRLDCQARQVPVSYESGKKEVMQVALAMQAAMQRLNKDKDIVLAACRSGGWLAYRPDAKGQLRRADEEQWAQVHLETAGRVSAEQLKPRYDWLDSSGKPERHLKTDYSKQEHLHLPGREPADEDLELEVEQTHLSEQEQAVAKAAQTHPALRADAELAAQVAGLTQHQKAEVAREAAQQAKERQAAKLRAGPTENRADKAADQKTKDRAAYKKTRKNRQQLLRTHLAEMFQKKLTEGTARGSVQERLAQLVVKVTGKGAKSAKQAKQARKDARRKEKKSKRVLTARKKAGKSVKISQRKMAGRKKWQGLAFGQAPSLGSEDGPLKGKAVRLVAPGLSGLHRNSSATVVSHYQAGNTVIVRLASGTIRDFPESQVYLLTGKEKVPLPEKLPLQSVFKHQREAALALAGGQLQTKLTAQSQLETPEVAASTAELMRRAQVSKAAWPQPGFVVLPAVDAMATLAFWQAGPGSEECQLGLAYLSEQLQPVLRGPDIEASICLPVCSYGHWTWLNYRRAARPAGQSEPNKWVAVYRDSLPTPSERCRDQAVIAHSMVAQLLGADSLASLSMPPVQKDSQQQPGDNTSCGFHVIAWTESEYRRLRGEGQYRLSENWRDKAESLTAFYKNAMLLKKPAPSAPPALPAADSLPTMPPPKNPPKTPLQVAGRPKALSATFGCSKCRYSKTGCLLCCPEKAQRYADRKAAESASETEGSRAGSASEAEGPPAGTASSSASRSTSLLDSLALPAAKQRRTEE